MDEVMVVRERVALVLAGELESAHFAGWSIIVERAGSGLSVDRLSLAGRVVESVTCRRSSTAAKLVVLWSAGPDVGLDDDDDEAVSL